MNATMLREECKALLYEALSAECSASHDLAGPDQKRQARESRAECEAAIDRLAALAEREPLKPLTEERVDDIAREALRVYEPTEGVFILAIIRAAERAHGIKG